MARRQLGRVGLVAFALIGALAVGISPAGADTTAWKTIGTKSSSTTGAAATCTLKARLSWGGAIPTPSQFPRYSEANLSCSIRDTAGDSASAFVSWKVDAKGCTRLTNKSGSGSTVTKSASCSHGDGIGTVQFKTCRDRTLGTDNCSGWSSWSPRR